MAAKEYSAYQQKIISRYYQNLDQTALQRLQELVTELYLADTDKKKNWLWAQVQKAMQNLKIEPAIAAHISSTRDVKILAKNIEDWLKKAR